MKHQILIIIFLLSITQLFAQDIWIERDTVNGPPRASCVGFSLYGVGFIALGRDYNEDKRTLYSYNIMQNDWDKEIDMGGVNGAGLERSSAISFVINNKAYVGTGKSVSPYLNDMWEFDAWNYTWTQKASFAGTPRRQAVAFSTDSLGYVGTGENENGLTKDFWQYNPELNQWTEIAEFAGTARKQAVGFSMGNKGYVGTGIDSAMFKKDFWEYNPIDDNWTQKADFAGTPRYGATAFAKFPQAVIATGYDNTLSYKKDVWEYNYFTDSWTQKDDFPAAERMNAISFMINNNAYLGTGFNGEYLIDFYEYQFYLSVESQNIKIKSSVFPNPAKSNFIIYTDYDKELILKFYNTKGQEITNNFIINKESDSKFNISTNDALKNGIYFYSISSNNKIVSTGRVIICK